MKVKIASYFLSVLMVTAAIVNIVHPVTFAADDKSKNTIGEPSSATEQTKFRYTDHLLAVAGDTSSAVTRNYFSDPGVLINHLVRLLFLGAGTMFFFLVLLSGYRLVFMGDKQQALEQNKRNLTTGVIGLLVVFAAYWLVEIIFILTGVYSGGSGYWSPS
ncbi:hypothetical protein IJJ27_00040 [bacterium]|nr:hypothetical protein [bacterium]MBQ6435940.1 hypothetical protein [bacterium]